MSKTIEQFIDDHEVDKILSYFTSITFPWFYLPRCIHYDVPGFVSPPVFRHSFIHEYNVSSPYCGLLDPILNRIRQEFGDVTFYRVSSNLLMPNDKYKNLLVAPHTDVSYESEIYDNNDVYTALFYLHDSDGDTVLFNECSQTGDLLESYTEKSRVSSRKNRFLYWDERTFHSAPATATEPRFVINFNFYKNKR